MPSVKLNSKHFSSLSGRVFDIKQGSLHGSLHAIFHTTVLHSFSNENKWFGLVFKELRYTYNYSSNFLCGILTLSTGHWDSSILSVTNITKSENVFLCVCISTLAHSVSYCGIWENAVETRKLSLHSLLSWFAKMLDFKSS